MWRWAPFVALLPDKLIQGPLMCLASSSASRRWLKELGFSVGDKTLQTIAPDLHGPGQPPRLVVTPIGNGRASSSCWMTSIPSWISRKANTEASLEALQKERAQLESAAADPKALALILEHCVRSPRSAPR